MEYEFLHEASGQVKVRMSMGHEAVGHWLNEEVKGDLAVLNEVEAQAKRLKGTQSQWQYTGHEYTLWMDDEEVIIRANQLAFEDQGLEEGLNYYDDENLALCGVDDFLAVLIALRNFLQNG